MISTQILVCLKMIEFYDDDDSESGDYSDDDCQDDDDCADVTCWLQQEQQV